MLRRPIMIMAGGTGGHVYPALAVAGELRRRGAELCWLGTRRGMESAVVPRHGLRMRTIAVEGVRGKGWVRLLTAPPMLCAAIAQACWLLLRERPAAVLGMGGFASGPGGLAAWLLRIPLLVHEQNAVLGLTNRLLAPLATRLMEAFPGTFGRARAVTTGNPVRPEIAALPAPRERMAGRAGPLRLLVLGGSQGAQALNELAPAALALLPPGSVEVLHQSGPRLHEACARAYAGRGLAARVEPFVEDMAGAYAWADLALCRAGALTLAELAAAGLGAILVPYPHAVDDHQSLNARWLEACGAALVVQQRELDAAGLARLLEPLLGARERLVEMAERARARALPRATETVAALCLEAAGA